jgi:hypothetical protein
MLAWLKYFWKGTPPRVNGMNGTAVRAFLTSLLIALPLAWWWQMPLYAGREIPGVLVRYLLVSAISYLLMRRFRHRRDLLTILIVVLAFTFELTMVWVRYHEWALLEFNTGQFFAASFGAVIGRIWSRYPKESA